MLDKPIIYFASPSNQQQAEHLCNHPVLLSFAQFSPFLFDYQQTFSRVLIDSGAYSVYNSGKTVDVVAYRDWSAQWINRAEAIAGLDDISGNYKFSMRNYQAIPWSFPTWHDTDPVEFLDDLIALAIERKTWLALGLSQPRSGKENVGQRFLCRVPSTIHVHGFALRMYANFNRFDSFDSTNWFRDAMALRKTLYWLTFGECIDLIIERYLREPKIIHQPDKQTTLFSGANL